MKLRTLAKHTLCLHKFVSKKMSKSANTLFFRKKPLLRVLLVVIFCLGLLFSHCARIVAPTGGPKDTIPPELLTVTPPDSTLHFDAQEIVFEFNEFIQLKNLRKQMIISPTPKRNPEINYKLNTLTVDWINKDSLSPNTTYIVNLGNSVVDLNEGNVYKDFRYVFSTGDHLDSLEIHGRVIDARTGLPDSTGIVMLYNTLKDSVVYQDKPLYYVRCKGDGSFVFQNLPPGKFKIFALVDENGDLKYNGGEEAIAFLKNPIQLDTVESGYLLSLFHEHEPEEEEKKGGEKKKKGKLTFQTSLSSQMQDLKKPFVFSFNHPLKSLNKKAIRLQEDTTHQPVSFEMKFDSTFSKDLKVSVDSAGNRDTTILRDTAVNQVELYYDWKEEKKYRLLIDSAFAVDTLDSAYAKKDTIEFTTKAKSDYGRLILKFDTTNIYKSKNKDTLPIQTAPAIEDSSVSDTMNLPTPSQTDSSLVAVADTSVTDSSLPDSSRLIAAETPAATEQRDTSYQLVIELYKEDKMIYSAPLKGDTWKKAYLKPGEYKIRVVMDVNKNGKWDRGCYFCKEKKQPEKVYSLPHAYNVKANWDNENDDLKIKFETGRLK